MAHSVLQQARYLMKRRKFGFAIRLLESYIANYKGSFEYYLALGTSCLYVGDEGDAARYYQLAREIHINSSELLLGQAALFLRHGNTVKALQYYMDILDIDPNNEQAKLAMEFIRTRGKDYAAIQKMKENKKIEKFYPPLGLNPDIIRNCVFVAILLALGIFIGIKLTPRESVRSNGDRGDLSAFMLTGDEKKNPVNNNISSNAIHYRMEDEEIIQAQNNAIMYCNNGRDNPARVEINRILNSNAKDSIKQKAYQLQSHLKEMTILNFTDKKTFPDADKDNYPYATVEGDHVLYKGCYVAWRGVVTKPQNNDDGSLDCTLLVGYHDGKHVEGMVDVHFSHENLGSSINPDRPISIFGVVNEKNGKLILDGRSFYQPVRGKFDD